MSSRSVGGESSGAGEVFSRDKHYRITVSILDKKKKLKTLVLKPEDEQKARTLLENVTSKGQASAWQGIQAPGNVIEFTEKGVYLKEHGKTIRPLTDDRRVVKRDVLKTIQETTTYFEGLRGKREERDSHPQTFPERKDFEKRLGRKGVVVEVEVLEDIDLFEEKFNQDWYFADSVRQQNTYLQSREGKAELVLKKFSKEQIKLMRERLDRLDKASSELNSFMRRVRDLMAINETQAAYDYYSVRMPSYYAEFCAAMQDWQKEQQVLNRVFGEGKSPLQIDLEWPYFHVETARKLFSQTSALSSVEASARSYTLFQSVQTLAQRRIQSLYEREWKLQDQISEALELLDDPEVTQGWRPEEIHEHRQRLIAFRAQSEFFLDILYKTHEHLAYGEVQEGMDYFASEMQVFYPFYADAFKNLITPQKLAKGRLMMHEELSQKLLIPSAHPQEFTTFLDEISQKSAEVLDTTRWEPSLQEMESWQADLNRARLSPLEGKVFGDHLTALRQQKGLGLFVAAFEKNREQFESIMRDKGLSDLQTAFIFNHYRGSFNAIQAWNMKMQEVVDLIALGKVEEALQKYSYLMEEEFPRLAKILLPENFAANEWDNAAISQGFRQFARSVGLAESAQIESHVTHPNLIPYARLKFIEVLDKAGEAGFPLSEHAKRARESVSATLNEFNLETVRLERLYKKDFRFIKFFNFAGLQSDPKMKNEWKSILKKQGWSLKDMEAFTVLYNQYASLIEPFVKAEQAISTERDPQKKRALQAQLKVLAIKVMPQVTKLHTEMDRLGGFRKLQTILTATEEIAAQQKGVSESSWKAGTGDEMKAEALDLVNLMNERIHFLNRLYTKMGFVPREKGKVTALLTGNDDLSAYLATNEWTPSKVQRFSSWYDAFMYEAHPLKHAKAALDADPENRLLQEEFKKVVKAQIPKLSKLSKEFNEKFKMVGVKSLKEAISDYSLIKTNEIDALLRTLDEDIADTRRQRIERKITELSLTVDLLSQVNFSKEILETNQFIMEAERISRSQMSWDTDVIDRLLGSISPFQFVKKERKETVWKTILTENGLSAKECTAISKLYKGYQRELHKINDLERKLDAHPEDNELRRELIRELQNRRPKLRLLEAQYVKLEDKIWSFRVALKELNIYLKTTLADIQEMEMLAKDDDSKDARALFQKGAHDMRERLIGNLSNAEIQDLISLSDRSNLFDTMREFMQSTYLRFGAATI